jgi:integrase
VFEKYYTKGAYMTIKFYIDKNQNTSNPSRAIYMYVNFSRDKRLVFNTGERIEPKYWDTEKQKVKRNYTGSPELNSFLVYLQEGVKKLYRLAIIEKNELSTDEFKKDVNKFITKTEPKDNENLFTKALDEFIASKRITRRHHTIQKYTTLREHLMKFEVAKGYKLTFDKINMEFYEKFMDYMFEDLQLTNNTAGKYVSTLKTFMLWAFEMEKSKNVIYKKFKVLTEKNDIIYLTEEELETLKNLELESEHLRNIKDVFLFSCYTGQRFSDVANLKREDIRGENWFLRTVKTKDALKIPLSRDAKKILLRYKDDTLPLPTISHQKTNDGLKELCKEAGFDEPTTKVRYRGGERVEINRFRYELVTTHTARRTFVTLSLEKGMRPEVVMEITGHKNYKTMQKYLKITDSVKEREFKQVWEKPAPLKLINY